MPTTIDVEACIHHAAQAKVVAEAKRFNVLQCGRRFGKTTLGQDLGVDVALNGFPVGWFAPTYKILDEAWREIKRTVAPVTRHVDKQQRRIELVTDGSFEFWSLDNDDPGRSRKYKRAIIDEAGLVKGLEEIWTRAIRPTLTDLRGDAWFLGTPKGKNYFHTLFTYGQTGRKGWASWRFATVENPYLDADDIAEAKEELPDLAFRQEYLGEAVEDGSNPFGESFIRACLAPLSEKVPKWWGWDLAKSQDWTVGIALDEDGHVCRFERWQAPWQTTIERIKALSRNQPALVDSTGVGDPVLEQLQREVGHKFEGFKFTPQSRQQLLEGLAVAIQRNVIRFPAGTVQSPGVLQTELESFGYEYTKLGVKYVVPEGLHDDTVMALALAQAKRVTHVPLMIGRATMPGTLPPSMQPAPAVADSSRRYDIDLRKPWRRS